MARGAGCGFDLAQFIYLSRLFQAQSAWASEGRRSRRAPLARDAMSHSTRFASVLCSFIISHGHCYEDSKLNARGAAGGRPDGCGVFGVPLRELGARLL